MSLGLLTGYGSGSESDNEEEIPAATTTSESTHNRLKLLAGPPPPPPPQPTEPLHNPLAHQSKKQKTIPGMSKKEMETMMKNAKVLNYLVVII